MPSAPRPQAFHLKARTGGAEPQEVSAVSKRRIVSLALSFTLALVVLTPQAALGNRVLYERLAGVSPTAASTLEPDSSSAVADGADTTGDADDDAQQPKHKGNGLARALSAPFRALARLFSGGRKSKAEEAKKAAPLPAVEAGASAATEVSKASPADSATRTALNVAPVEAPTTRAPDDVERSRNVAGGIQAPEGARILRPAGDEVAQELRPKMWIPLIAGIPADPVSQGRALLQHGYLQEAIAELQIAATTVGPDLAEANNLLGLAYDRLGWHKQAAEAYGRSLTVTPKDANVLANLGYSLYLADDYAGALKRLKQAASLAPGEPVISNNLGIVHARLSHYDDAFKYFARASNEYEAHLKLAGILEEQKRDRDAVKHYEAALRIQPGASAVLERLVALYERTGERDKADTARRALGQPRNPQKTTTGGGG
jgi:Flp pilus assembly protein TadD